ncbi:MAG: hypothetical protein ACLVBB_05555 [Dysosmobacter welbionis]
MAGDQDGWKCDTTIIGNAVEKYRELFNQLYDAANDFLVAHGYEPIGFIRGYAPHLQSQETQERFNSALERMGINREIGKLPTSIAGRTKNFKPNMPWNGFFKNRNSQGEFLDPDIAEGFEKYVDSMSDVLYHTDDIMRTRLCAVFQKNLCPGGNPEPAGAGGRAAIRADGPAGVLPAGQGEAVLHIRADL